MLGDEYQAFLDSYDEGKICALRVNTLKLRSAADDATAADGVTTADAKIRAVLAKTTGTASPEQVGWCSRGFYYDEETRPGAHPYHEAGLYYIQDASAMMPAELLDPRPGDYVLDLCAAPGGKSTQIGVMLGGEGLLISNEIHPARAKILSENIERLGIKNAIVTNETPDSLSAKFEEALDKILVDAPCSGEGMFRKNEDACAEWSPENVKMCAKRQDDILNEAVKMLKPGGRLVYSTCTFARDEDEGSVERLLASHSEMKCTRMERLWPHKIKGEGHFVAVLEKAAGGLRRPFDEETTPKKIDISLWKSFEKENLKIHLEGVFTAFGDQIYLLPKGAPKLKGLKVVRPGLHLGTNKKNRFEPSHALALALSACDVKRSADFDAVSAEIRDYLGGNVINHEGEAGWTLVTVDGFSIGWGKQTGAVLKNHYPKGLRR